MALSSKSGQFAAGTADTTTEVTGLGFIPKAIIFFAVDQLTAGSDFVAGSGGMAVGFTDGTNHRYSGWAGDNNVATSNTGTSYSTSKCIGIMNDGTPTVDNEATCAFDADGFTLTWNSTPGSAWLIGYWAVGGSDITNVNVGSVAMDTDLGAQSVTGPGFQPTIAFVMHSSATAAGTAAGAKFGFGVAVSSAKEAAVALNVADGATMSSTVNSECRFSSANTIMGLANPAIELAADFTQFTANGFDINFSDASPSAYLFSYLVIKGGQWDCGTSATPASATTQSVASMSFQPTTMGIFGSEPTAVDSNTGGAKTAIGAAVSTSTETSCVAQHTDVINTTMSRGNENAKILSLGSTIEADFTSFNSNGWTITWAVNPASRLTMWWAGADNAAAPSGWGGLLSDQRNRIVQG